MIQGLFLVPAGTLLGANAFGGEIGFVAVAHEVFLNGGRRQGAGLDGVGKILSEAGIHVGEKASVDAVSLLAGGEADVQAKVDAARALPPAAAPRPYGTRLVLPLATLDMHMRRPRSVSKSIRTTSPDWE